MAAKIAAKKERQEAEAKAAAAAAVKSAYTSAGKCKFLKIIFKAEDMELLFALESPVKPPYTLP